MSSTLETALCLAQKFDSYIEWFALRVANPAAYAMADAAAVTRVPRSSRVVGACIPCLAPYLPAASALPTMIDQKSSPDVHPLARLL